MKAIALVCDIVDVALANYEESVLAISSRPLDEWHSSSCTDGDDVALTHALSS